MRMKIGVMFGDPRKTTGGQAPEFYFSQRLWLSSAQIKQGTEVIGQEVTGKFMKNKIARPFLQAKWRFIYQNDGTGRFDVERSLVEFLHEINAFAEKGADGRPKAGSVIWGKASRLPGKPWLERSRRKGVWLISRRYCRQPMSRRW